MDVQWNDRRGGCTCTKDGEQLPPHRAVVQTIAGICSHRMYPASQVNDVFPNRIGDVLVAELLATTMTMWREHRDTGDAVDHIFAFMVVTKGGSSFLLSRQDDEAFPYLYWNMCGEAISDVAKSEPIFNYGFHSRMSIMDYIIREIGGKSPGDF